MSTKNDVGTTCKQAIQVWQQKTQQDPTQAKKIMLNCQVPFVKKMDSALNNLSHCEHLSLSTNQIERIAPLSSLKMLKTLSLGRNNIKKFENLESISSSLEELWLSYNLIEKLDGASSCKKLKVLYLSNNQIRSFDELVKLRDCSALEEILLIGNPCYTQALDDNGLPMIQDNIRIEVLKRLPKLKKIDAIVVSELEREKAEQTPSSTWLQS